MNNQRLIKNIFRCSQTHMSATREHKFFTANNKFGIEVEMEQVPQDLRNKRFSYWCVIDDSSLRGDSCEFVLKRPMNGDALYRAVNELFNNEQFKLCDPSWRTSIHIHIDVREWSVSKLMKFSFLYLQKERELFEKYGDGRWFSNFCVPLNNQPRLIKHIFRDRITSLQSDCNKYSALNFRPMSGYGSIEWRGANATTEITVMRSMLQDLCEMINAAENAESLVSLATTEEEREAISYLSPSR